MKHLDQEASFKSTRKAFRILMAFHVDRPSWGVRELSVYLGLSPATVQRLLGILKEYAFVDQDPQTRRYRLGNVYYHFLHILHSTYPVTKIAKPFMKDLATRTQETVHLNVVEGLERLCIDTVDSPQYLKASMPVGEKSPLYAGASAKCLLAFSSQDFIDEYLKDVRLIPLTERTLVDLDVIRRELGRYREQGYASSVGERDPGVASLSAPILDYSSVLLASISLSIPEIRYHDAEHRKFCLRALLETATAISKAMGYRDS
jgi:IclR family transcriptional regulator, KDG regulon repressor